MKNSLILKQTEMLEKMFDLYNKTFFNEELHDVALTIQTCGRKQNTLGWCSIGTIWVENKKPNGEKEENSYREINLSAEFMNGGIYEVSSTLIHEMVHALNSQRGVKDCNPKTQNHNKHFRELAEQSGLHVERMEKRGWADTSLTPMTYKKIEDFLKEGLIEDVFNFARTAPEKPTVVRKPKRKYFCNCGTKFSSTKDIDATCNVCGQKFDYEEE